MDSLDHKKWGNRKNQDAPFWSVLLRSLGKCRHGANPVILLSFEVQIFIFTQECKLKLIDLLVCWLNNWPWVSTLSVIIKVSNHLENHAVLVHRRGDLTERESNGNGGDTAEWSPSSTLYNNPHASIKTSGSSKSRVTREIGLTFSTNWQHFREPPFYPFWW